MLLVIIHCHYHWDLIFKKEIEYMATNLKNILESSGMNLKNKKIALIGGAGFIGHNLAISLKKVERIVFFLIVYKLIILENYRAQKIQQIRTCIYLF